MSESSHGLVLTSPEGTRYLFDPGALCLEFLTTGGPGALSRYEVLHTPADLADWLGRCRLGLDPADVRTAPEDVAAGRRLRDALWGLARAAADGGPLAAGDLTELHRAAARPPLVPYVTAGRTRGWDASAEARQALSTIARDAVELLTGRFAGRIRVCGADDCFLVFVDTSRPGRRRWCAMERCGNRHKVRALRARRDTEENTAP
ncbi:CGNR zinc finger domain-containing protein [Streptomyces sp. HD1123-B1]|uniref:CGNR zinc finger domain-containing protein n=1 Tax=Streptomyces huangiella TaxID=3228804 RepID=UPI003D7EF938